ncbi:hypothetical protein DPMN_099546 [Dreissena polymorpha]|uniref:Uncharacterized protein n=1 Tax=Dreissena polymorpha TaxID=45954 RepID=A0A9D4R8A1_DREPO|nr:hypothetical protein DPMN_099546 [Dreissena polymorpha]
MWTGRPRVRNGAMNYVQYQFEVNRCRNKKWALYMWTGRPRVGNGAKISDPAPPQPPSATISSYTIITRTLKLTHMAQWLWTRRNIPEKFHQNWTINARTDARPDARTTDTGP